jgi:hypothetical protein
MPKIPKQNGKYYIGVDPGASGGLAAFLPSGRVQTIKMPATERDIYDWFYPWEYTDAAAVIEKVGGYIGTGQPGSAMFKFGTGYGGLRMAMIANGIPFEEITPQKWQRALGITPKKKEESKTQWKNRLKAVAQQLFPHVIITLATADAILIAEYCKRKHQGTLGR